MEVKTLRDLGMKLWSDIRNGADILKKITELKIPEVIANSSLQEFVDFIVGIYSDDPDTALKIIEVVKDSILECMSKSSRDDLKNMAIILSKQHPQLMEKIMIIFEDFASKVIEGLAVGQLAKLIREVHRVNPNIATKLVSLNKEVLKNMDYETTPLMETGYFIETLYEIDEKILKDILNEIESGLCRKDIIYTDPGDIGRLLWLLTHISPEITTKILNCQKEKIRKLKISKNDIEGTTAFLLGLQSVDRAFAEEILAQNLKDITALDLRGASFNEIIDLIWTVTRIGEKYGEILLSSYETTLRARILSAGINEIRRFLWKIGTVSKKTSVNAYEHFADVIKTKVFDFSIPVVARFIGVMNIDTPCLAKKIARDFLSELKLKEKIKTLSAPEEIAYALEIISFAEGSEVAMNIFKEISREIQLGKEIERRILRPLKKERYEDLTVSDELWDISTKMFFKKY